MTLQEQCMATCLGECRFLPATREKRFAQDMAYLARHEPDKALSYKQQKYLGGLFWQYREQIARHRGEPVRIPVCRIAKGMVGGEVAYYGMFGRKVQAIEAVTFYCYQAAKVSVVSLLELAGCVESPTEECQLILKFAA